MNKCPRQIYSLVLTLAVLLAGLMLCPGKAEAADVPAVTGLSDLQAMGYTLPEQPEISARSGYLIELNTGEVLYEKNADEQRYPASITKILTALIVLENCEPDEQVTFSHASVTDLEDGGYDSRFREGEVLTVEQCLYGLMLDSVNSCAYALAEHVAGSVEAFAELMNKRAAEIGCTKSNFVNPHGLNNENHTTTAHDMALIMWTAVNNPDFLKIDSTLTYEVAPTALNPKGYTFTMNHKMLDPTGQYYYEAVLAGKTGYTSLAHHTLVTYAERDGVQLICVVMKEANGGGTIYEDTSKLLDYGFDNFTLRDDTDTAEQYISALNAISGIPVYMDASFVTYMPSAYGEPVFGYSAVSETGAIGTLALSYGGITAVSAPVYVRQDLLTLTQKTEADEGQTAGGTEGDGQEEETGTSAGGVLLRILIWIAGIVLAAIIIYRIIMRRIRIKRRKARAARLRQRSRMRRMGASSDGTNYRKNDYQDYY